NGVAGLASICQDNRKGQGFTAADPPVGDPFAIDYLAHEIGHQFGGNHTQNNNCNRVGNSAVEPGSASTIMGYAGICPPNLQSNSDPYFHAVSQEEMLNYTLNGVGASCATFLETGNTTPEVEAGESGLVIPLSTPFELMGQATDAEGDSLSYCWEQMDVGPSSSPNNPQGNAPLFRSFLPQSDPLRVFPRISDLVENTTVVGEILPSYERSMAFRLTVRDHFGGVGFDDRSLTVSADAGPFVVLSQNTPQAWTAGTLHLVEWDVANTDQAPVNTDSVFIYLSEDGGFSYPHLLSDGAVPNDGKQLVVIPDSLQGDAFRLKVKAADNVFFDINDENFSIIPSETPGLSLGTDQREMLACGGDTVRYTVEGVGVLGLQGRAAVRAEGLPGGLNLIAADSIDLPGQLAVSLAGTESLPTGLYPFSLIAERDSVADTLLLALRLFAGAPGPSALLFPGEDQEGVSVNPTLVWAAHPDAETYRLEVALDPFFNDLYLQEGDLVDTTYQITGLPDSTVIYWRVIGQNASCGSGLFSANAFLTERLVCETFVSEEVPIDLGDSAPFLFSALEVDLNQPVRDVNVVNLAGSFSPIDNIEIRLISPDGATVELYGGDCESGITVFSVALDDEAQDELPCPLLGGVFRPKGTLRDFNDSDPQGEWNLGLNKTGGGSGELTAWSLEICYPATLNAAAEVGQVAKRLNIYPNPASEKIWVELGGSYTEARRLELYSLTGQRLRHRVVEGWGPAAVSLSVQGLPAGLYVMQVRAASGALLGYSRVVVE
ncbi:MAG TPA: zinc-dependent metalloprotease family protein, partial [Phaeodactylibacter sp.]|nr:zinc-dependent metalloprotease family protein [Phaeodactylibacter sp.]